MLNPASIFQTSLHTCISPLLKNTSLANRCGLIFGLPVLAQSPLTLEFLTNIILPGFPTIGISASLEPIAADGDEIQKQLRRTHAVLLFTIPAVKFHDWDEDSIDSEIPDEIEISKWVVIHEAEDVLRTSGYTHWLRLQKYTKTEPRQESVLRALLRAMAYSSTFPDRLLNTIQPETGKLLQELAPIKRTPYAVRMRRSSAAFENGDISGGFQHLREAVLPALHLPGLVEAALLSAPAEKLDGVFCRELIYLARAGTLEMKMLAAVRLSYEKDNSDIVITLSELRKDPHAWVRRASAFNVS